VADGKAFMNSSKDSRMGLGRSTCMEVDEVPCTIGSCGGNNLVSGFLQFVTDLGFLTLNLFPWRSSFYETASFGPSLIRHSRRPGAGAGENSSRCDGRGSRLVDGMADGCFACSCRDSASYENEEKHMSVYEQSQDSPGVEVI
jgi:hypothetical protein